MICPNLCLQLKKYIVRITWFKWNWTVKFPSLGWVDVPKGHFSPKIKVGTKKSTLTKKWGDLVVLLLSCRKCTPNCVVREYPFQNHEERKTMELGWEIRLLLCIFTRVILWSYHGADLQTIDCTLQAIINITCKYDYWTLLCYCTDSLSLSISFTSILCYI